MVPVAAHPRVRRPHRRILGEERQGIGAARLSRPHRHGRLRLRFRGTCYRAHDPRWSFKPLSGDGAAIHGGRFNPKGVPALYLSLTIGGAIKEANQGFAFKIDPCVLCSYEVDCNDVADLRTNEGRAEHGVAFADMACAWFSAIADGK